MKPFNKYTFDRTKPALKLVLGKDKVCSTAMRWELVGTNFTIGRAIEGASVNASRKVVTWLVGNGERLFYIPHGIHRHEVSIAKWILETHCK